MQDSFLNTARKESVEVTVYLVNGVQVRGKVKGFDNYILLLESNGKIQMVYKHAISTVAPMKRMPLIWEEEEDTPEAPRKEEGSGENPA